MRVIVTIDTAHTVGQHHSRRESQLSNSASHIARNILHVSNIARNIFQISYKARNILHIYHT